jgi:hypothetical protein
LIFSPTGLSRSASAIYDGHQIGGLIAGRDLVEKFLEQAMVFRLAE